MRLNNLKRGAFHKYDITYVESQKKWFAWFVPYQFTAEERANLARTAGTDTGGDNG